MELSDKIAVMLVTTESVPLIGTPALAALVSTAHLAPHFSACYTGFDKRLPIKYPVA